MFSDLYDDLIVTVEGDVSESLSEGKRFALRYYAFIKKGIKKNQKKY